MEALNQPAESAQLDDAGCNLKVSKKVSKMDENLIELLRELSFFTSPLGPAFHSKKHRRWLESDEYNLQVATQHNSNNLNGVAVEQNCIFRESSLFSKYTFALG